MAESVTLEEIAKSVFTKQSSDIKNVYTEESPHGRLFYKHSLPHVVTQYRKT